MKLPQPTDYQYIIISNLKSNTSLSDNNVLNHINRYYNIDSLYYKMDKNNIIIVYYWDDLPLKVYTELYYNITYKSEYRNIFDPIYIHWDNDIVTLFNEVPVTIPGFREHVIMSEREKKINIILYGKEEGI